MIFGLSACSEKDNTLTPSNSHQQIYPLNVGNTWYYTSAYFDTAGHQIGTGYHPVVRLLSDTTMFNKDWFVANDGYSFFTNEEDGCHRYWNSLDPSQRYEGLYVPYPVQKGKLYYTVSIFMRSLYVDTVIQLASKKYSCYGFSSAAALGSEMDSVLSYFSLGVGLVRAEELETTSNGFHFVAYRMNLDSCLIK